MATTGQPIITLREEQTLSSTKQGTTITMPKLGESVTEGTLGSWLKQVGDVVEKYEPMVEVVTDKVTAEIPAPVAGTIVEIVGGEGETIPVGGVICVISETDSEGSSLPSGEQETPAASASREEPPDTIEPPRRVADTPTGQPRDNERDTDISLLRDRRDEAGMLRARSSPVVRRLAEEHEIDLAMLQGSGIGGRVTKADILAEIEQRRQAPEREPETARVSPPTPAPQHAPVEQPATQRVPVQLMPGDEVIDASIMRRQIAEHMQRSVQTAPHVTVWMEADMSGVVEARDRHKADFAAREGFNLTYLPFLLRVVTDALRQHPNLNAAWDDGKIIRRRAINIGIAVALEDGLIVPVIRNADEKNIVGLARAVNDLTERARTNRLSPDDVTGGTFTVNNPGTLGSMFSTPIIVQPQAAILSMEAIVKRPVVVDDAIAIRPMMNLSLSIDHRILDGLAATRFLAAIKAALESYPADGALT
jgi:2-oxoisovalerate dehydrogenase E2 component (dihydrolipoyl transacylase)